MFAGRLRQRLQLDIDETAKAQRGPCQIVSSVLFHRSNNTWRKHELRKKSGIPSDPARGAQVRHSLDGVPQRTAHRVQFAVESNRLPSTFRKDFAQSIFK